METPGDPWRPGRASQNHQIKKIKFKKTVIKLVLHFHFQSINGVKAVKILVDARKRHINV